MESCHEKKIIIAIDGFSSGGKSTFAREIAKRMGYVFVDTGSMYRAVTLFAMEHGLVRDGKLDEQGLLDALDGINISFKFNPGRGASDIYLNDRNVEAEIRTVAVSDMVTAVSGIPEVREKLVKMQQDMGRSKGVVMDGRDVGTVVFPSAELKIFLTADPAIRARRRYDEMIAKGYDVSLEEIERNIRQRDEADQKRKVGPLRKAVDAIVLDNSYMTLEEQMDWVMKKVAEICDPAV